MSRSNSHIAANRGFSLTELLVAVAITVTLLGGILGLFLAVMQTTARGHAVQQAFELARGTYETIENDLAAAYVSRDTGDDFKFFGCPFGFMFIAALDPEDPTKLSRVSYFVHVESANGEVEFQNPTTGEFEPVVTVSLVRFVEPGITDLDVYPVDFLRYIEDPLEADEDVEFEFQNIAFEMGDTRSGFIDDGVSTLAVLTETRLDPTVVVSPERDAMLRSKLREVWLRMLAGDPNFPRAFNDPLLDGEFFIIDADWRDYVLAERFAFSTRGGAAVQDPGTGQYQVIGSLVDYVNPELVTPQYFSYGTRFNVSGVRELPGLVDGLITGPEIVVNDRDTDGDFDGYDEALATVSIDMFTTFWGSVYNVTHANAIYTPIPGFVRSPNAPLIGSPLDPGLPELIAMNTGVELSSPFVGVPQIDEDFHQVIDVPAAFSRKQDVRLSELLVGAP